MAVLLGCNGPGNPKNTLLSEKATVILQSILNTEMANNLQ